MIRSSVKVLKSIQPLSFASFSKRNLPFPDNSLQQADPEIWELIEKEKERQWHGIELIASENYVGTAVLETLGSVTTNKYSEGYPGARYYGGNKYIDQIENICRKRALEAFSLDPSQWGVNVQPLSGSPANFAAYTALIKPNDRLMGLDLYCGGHLTHGFKTETKIISATSLFFQSKSYQTDPKTSLIDYDGLAESAKEFKPHLIIAGASAYPRDWDYKRMRDIADSVGAYLLSDMAHISGLVSAGYQNNPFEWSDVVTSTTHKSLRGPRSGIIFFNKGKHPHLENDIDFSVFPRLQGGPHNHQIAALAVQLKEVASPAFKQYIGQVCRNAKKLSESMIKRGMTITTGGTDNHLFMWNVRADGLTGSKMEKILESVHITVNKNTIQGDKSAMNPGGIRIGVPAVTSRGMIEEDMDKIAEFMVRTLEVAKKVQDRSGAKLVDFLKEIENDKDVKQIEREVIQFSREFQVPGIKGGKYII